MPGFDDSTQVDATVDGIGMGYSLFKNLPFAAFPGGYIAGVGNRIALLLCSLHIPEFQTEIEIRIKIKRLTCKGQPLIIIGRTVSRFLFYLVIYLRNLPPG